VSGSGISWASRKSAPVSDGQKLTKKLLTNDNNNNNNDRLTAFDPGQPG